MSPPALQQSTLSTTMRLAYTASGVQSDCAFLTKVLSVSELLRWKHRSSSYSSAPFRRLQHLATITSLHAASSRVEVNPTLCLDHHDSTASISTG